MIPGKGGHKECVVAPLCPRGYFHSSSPKSTFPVPNISPPPQILQDEQCSHPGLVLTHHGIVKVGKISAITKFKVLCDT